MFFLHIGDTLCGIVCCHVDDFLHAGDERFENMINSLRKRFVAGKVEEKILITFISESFRTKMVLLYINLDMLKTIEN